MSFSAADQASIKADIIANPDLNNQPNTSNGADAIASLYNLEAVPEFTVYKTSVTVVQVGDAFDGSDLDAITSLENDRLGTFAAYSGESINPSLPDRRLFFEQVFSGQATTRGNLDALWRRFANRLEKLLAVGAGSDLDPALLTFEGRASHQDIFEARNS